MGALRLYLAICVAVTHYAPAWRPNWIAFSFVAVLLFYLVSGFYMSLILTEQYRDRTGAFFLNRALRLYPPYFVALAGMVVLTNYGMIPNQVHFFNADHLLWIFNQITVFPHVIWRNLTGTMADGGIMMAQFYTVGLEMIFYALAPLLVRLRTRTLLLMLPVALALHFLPEYLGLPRREWQYDFFPSLLVFFLLGCLSYRLYVYVRHVNLPRWLGYAVAPAILLLVLLNSSSDWTDAPAPWAIYAGVTLGIPFLFRLTKNSKADKLFGNFAYPLYLVHNLAIWSGQASFAAGTRFEWLAVAALMAIMSAALWYFVDRPIDRKRDVIAGRSVDRLAPHAAAEQAPSYRTL
jgi:peptidoglycan/LPS O-acetylase OafA/YrhL